MTEPASAADAPLLETVLDALRSQGAALCRPAQWRYIEVLARRWREAAEPATRAVLADKLHAALHTHAAHLAAASEAAPEALASPAEPALPAARSSSPLAALNRHIDAAQRASRPRADSAVTDRLADDEPDDPSEMKSLRRFRQTWAQLATDKQVSQTLASAPDHAGPLNSHRLVVRTLALLRDLSPDYLRRFVSQVDVLLWLDQANQKLTLSSNRPAAKSLAIKGPAIKNPATKSTAAKPVTAKRSRAKG